MNSNKQTLHYDDFYYDSKQGMRRLEVHKSDLGWHLVFFLPCIKPCGSATNNSYSAIQPRLFPIHDQCWCYRAEAGSCYSEEFR